MSTTTLHLAKQNFKFSAAHFLIFDETHAERLHGHNYQVRVDIKTPAEAELHAEGYFLDFNVFKKYIKARLDQWDEIVLLPQKHPDMKFKQVGPSLEVTFRDRFYVFPSNEVILLPVTNTSVEQLSRLLAEDFYSEFKQYGVSKVRVYVEETRGQGAATVVPGPA
ncbi:MAG: 6-pyruvoyl tetrahydropterin synthase [Bdellovibrio sp. ArHS]|uniref:6-pyruvoyl trahydropterin synthase family protein n=1 Tax=Bdellovibrio sp. ArHS TaxID=1569284 RepID=UPI0005839C98|nr:6-carboxytetrahydropterin synthase [Bdellovibrio sp. ArHS]KHD87929.1 MAG: 6-pyruvoyl tetrahydropterin synthase [Bdellovibrio sp. ArHS]